MIGIVIVDDIVNAIHDFFRSFMITLDKIVYWFVEQVLQLIVDLANVNIFTDTTINAFARRIYVLLGLVMVFKLMISFIQILIDPDAMSDKEKGVGNVLKRVVISMALIVLVPSIFKMARDVQGYILPIIPKVVLGIDSGNNVTEPITEHNIGNVMAWYSFLPFFDYVNDECAATGTIQKAVGGDMAVYEIYSVSTAADHINDKNSCNNGSYMYSHKYLISTLVGAYLLFTLVQVALNVAIRAIKFGICEFVAPIPIASYIDPKTSKSTFDKWVNTSIKVYLDLFIQLISIYFVVFVFMVVFKPENIGAILENVGNDMWRTTLVILFIIVGLIKFVKEFPKFLSELLGLKTDGALTSIFKGDGWKTLGAAAGGVFGMAHAGLSARNYSNAKGENGFRQAGRTVGAMLRTGAGGLKATADGKGFKASYGVAGQVHQGTMRRVNKSYNKKNVKDEYNSNLERYNNAQTDITNLNGKLDNERNLVLSANQRATESWNEYIAAKQRGDTRAANIHKINYDNAKANSARHQKEIDKLESQIADLEKIRKPMRPTSYGIGRIDAAIKNFAGTPVPDSGTYHQAGQVMNQGKAIFNEAKAKITEKPTLIQDKLGTIKYTDSSGITRERNDLSFSDVFQVYKDVTEGRGVRDSRFAGISRSELETIYGDALKDTAAKYVDKVETGEIDNVSMREKIKRWDTQFNNELVISEEDRNRVKDKIKTTSDGQKQHGSLFKGADNIGEEFETVSSILKDQEKAKKG